MKKLIILFLISVTGYAQTSNGTEFEADAFKSNNPQTVTTAANLATMGADGTIGKTLPANLPLSSSDLKSYSGNKARVNTKKKAVFTFIWDDLQDSNSLVYNIFQEFGYVPNYALDTAGLNSSNAGFYVDAYQKGCSILAHSITHQDMSGTTLTNAQANTEMVGSKTAIEAFGIRVSGWVTPMSVLNSKYYPEVDKNFGYAYVNNSGALDLTVAKTRLRRVGLETEMAGHNLANVKAIIDDAIANKYLVSFYGHHLPSTYLNGDSTPYLTEADLRDILTYLKTKSDDNLCEVLSSDEAINTYYGNSIFSDNGITGFVDGLLSTKSALNTEYSPAFSTASIVNIMGINSTFQGSNKSALINFGAEKVGNTGAVVYAGALNTSTDYQSIFVLGRRTGATSWLESLRVNSIGQLGINTTAPSSQVTIANGASGEQLNFIRGTGNVRIIQPNNLDDLIFYNGAATKSMIRLIGATGELSVPSLLTNGIVYSNGGVLTNTPPSGSGGVLSGSGTISMPGIASGSRGEATIAVSGANVGDVVAVGITGTLSINGTCITARVVSTNNVSIIFNNYSGATVNFPSSTIKVKVFQ